MKTSELSTKYHFFSGIYQGLVNRFDYLEEEVKHKKVFIQNKEAVLKFLETIQTKEHQKMVGKFEKWLTSLYQDVFQEKHEIKFQLHTDYHKTGLDIFLKKGDNLEDVFQGNGGALTNVITTGLKLISVAVTNKNFLVLDEPDCWMRADLLPRFFNTISQFSKELGIQIVVISHHQLKNWADKEIFLENFEEKTFIKDEDVNTFSESFKKGTIHSIILENWMQYESEAFYLSPHVTLISGANNIGKSAILQALRCLFYNENPQSFIRHGMTSSAIKVNFGEQEVVYNATHKKTNYVAWELWENGKMKIATEGSRNFPEWMNQFNIGLLENIDVQLSRQKEPALILASNSSTRAQLLSLNQEFSYAQKLLELFKKESKQAGDFIKNSEIELTNLKFKINQKPVLDSVKFTLAKTEVQEEEITFINTAINAAINNKKEIDAFDEKMIIPEVGIITTLDFKALDQHLIDLFKYFSIEENVESIFKEIPTAQILNWHEIDRTAKALERELLFIDVLDNIPEMLQPIIFNNYKLENDMVKNHHELLAQAAEIDNRLSELANEDSILMREKEEFSLMGCPICGTPIEGRHIFNH